MKHLITFALLAFSANALAELSYPVDHTARWFVVDTATCELTQASGRPWPRLDPDTYDCDTEPCGVEIEGKHRRHRVGRDDNFGRQAESGRAPLMGVQLPIPEYDPSVQSVQTTYLICGPDSGTCYDPACTATDQYVQVSTIVEGSKESQYEALDARTLTELQYTVPTSEQPLMPWTSLVTAYADVYKAAAVPILQHRQNLIAEIEAGTIEPGDIDEGWPEPTVRRPLIRSRARSTAQ